MAKKKEVRRHRIVAIRRSKDQQRIAQIRFTNPVGLDFVDWSVDKAVKKVEAGTDEFMVATTVWSPVEVSRHKKMSGGTTKYLKTVEDSCAHSNLENLPTF